MDDDGLIERVCRTAAGYLELGNEAFDADGARFVRNSATTRRYDANHVHLIRADGDDFARVLTRADETYGALPYRRFDTDPLTPPDFAARLTLAGFAPSYEIRLLLEGDLRVSSKPCDIRAVHGDAAWAAYERLAALDWEETRTRQGKAADRDVPAGVPGVPRGQGAARPVLAGICRPRAGRVLLLVAGSCWRRHGRGLVHTARVPSSRHRHGADRSLRRRSALTRRARGHDRRRPHGHADADVRGDGLPAVDGHGQLLPEHRGVTRASAFFAYMKRVSVNARPRPRHRLDQNSRRTPSMDCWMPA